LIWQNRYRVASSGLLIGLAALAGGDFLARFLSEDTLDSSALLVLAISGSLLASALFASLLRWEELGMYWRAAPAVAGILALVAGIFGAGLADTSYAATGLALAATGSFFGPPTQ